MTAPNPQQPQQPTNPQQGQGGPAGGQQPQPPQQPQGPPGQPGDQQSQQPGQQQPNPWQGLLDVAPPAGGQQQLGQPQLGQLYPGQQFTAPPAGGMDPTQVADMVARAVNSQVDRIINAQRNPQWQQAHGQPPAGHPPQQGAPPSPQQTYQPPVPTGPSDADQREARMAATAYLGDQIQFGSADERAMAVDLTASLIPAQLALGFTPNQAGLAVAQQVAQRVTALRRSYEDQAVRALRGRGLLVETPQVPAQMAGSVGVPVGGTPASATNQHQAAAKQKHMLAIAAEENTQRGWGSQPGWDKAATPATG